MAVFNVTAAASPGLRPPQYDPEDLGIFESARMDREMAREMGQNSQRRNKKSVIGTALANMSTARLLILVVGVLLLVGGLLALRFPVFLTDFDQWGFQINCGTGFGSDWTQAATAEPEPASWSNATQPSRCAEPALSPWWWQGRCC
jgi:hypothetical protein